jgi:hypothetical protein
MEGLSQSALSVGYCATNISVGLAPVGMAIVRLHRRVPCNLHTPASLSRRLKSFAIRRVFFPTAVPRSLAGREREYLAFLPDKQAGERA